MHYGLPTPPKLGPGGGGAGGAINSILNDTEGNTNVS